MTERELAAYRFTVRRPDFVPFAESTAARMFALFLSGTDCARIAELNKMPLGEVVAARVRGRWDERREQYADDLLAATQDRLRRVALESVEFLVDQISVAHRRYGEQLKRYIQSGDEADLPDFALHGLKDYRAAHELLADVVNPSAGRRAQRSDDEPPAKDVVPSEPAKVAGVGARDLIRSALKAQGKADGAE